MNVIAIGLVHHEGRYVVGRREGGAVLAGCHEFPGGKCEGDETPQQAVVREVAEETGLEIRVVGLRQRVTHEYPHGRLDLHFFDCETVSREGWIALKAPFEWWERERLAQGQFPEANQTVIESILQSPT